MTTADCWDADLYSSDEIFDEIWSFQTRSKSDLIGQDLIWSARWACSGRGSGWARCAQTCTETESRLTQEQKNYLSNLGNGLHHQHPLLSQVWKNLGLKREFEKCFKKKTLPLECQCQCCDRRSISKCRRVSSRPFWKIRYSLTQILLPEILKQI